MKVRIALILAAGMAAVPAVAAEAVEMELDCSAMRPGWTAPRAFTVTYVGGNKQFKDVVVTEKARVFTPTDETSIYVARGKQGGVITTLPSKRDGKWSGRVEDEGDAFTMRAKDGGASFVLVRDPADQRRRLLTWKADMEVAKDQELSVEGDGTCRVVSPEAADRPAAEADASQASKADAPLAPKTPRKEIRLFGGRKKGTPEEGESSK